MNRKEPQAERGNLIRSRREKRHISIGGLAKILNKKAKAVYEMETRKSPKMKFKTAECLAQAFNLKASSFDKFVGLERVEAKGKIGKRVRSRRNELHLTQEQLARKVGKTRAYISAIESGKVKLKFATETRRLLAEALGLDPSRLAP